MSTAFQKYAFLVAVTLSCEVMTMLECFYTIVPAFYGFIRPSAMMSPFSHQYSKLNWAMLKRDAGQAGLEGHYVQPLNKDDPYIRAAACLTYYGMEEFPYSPVNTVLTIHRPVYRAPLKERIGVLSIDFKLDRLRNLSDMLYDKGNEHLYLLDDTGTTVYSSETEWIGQKPPHSWLQHARYNLFQSGYFDWC